jgi:hypothetical protein
VRVCWLTARDSLMTCETVATDTPASLATSLMVGIRPVLWVAARPILAEV